MVIPLQLCKMVFTFRGKESLYTDVDPVACLRAHEHLYLQQGEDYRSHRNMVASNLVYRGILRGPVKSKQ